MKGILSRLVVYGVFFGLMIAAFVLSHRAQAGPPMPSGAHGFTLEEIAKEAGIDFVHQAPTFDPKLDHIMPEVASMGAAASVVDYDRDGKNDLYVIDSKEGSLNRLYHNVGNYRFEEVGQALGVGDVNRPGTGVSMGAIWADYDNDGFEDLYVNKFGRPLLFHNDGGKGFTDVSDGAGLPKWLNATSAVWFDYDRDGKVDLFIGGYYDEKIDLWHLTTTRIMPDSFEYAQNGGRKYLFRNVGEGKFEDVTEAVGLDSHRWALAAAAADLRGTGYPDLVIANDYGVSEFWANDGGKRFREIGKEVGVAERPKSGMNVTFGDIFNDGRLSLYITNISTEDNNLLIQENNLWVPVEGSAGNDLKYENRASGMEVHLGGWSFGTQFGDLNNDGWQDLFLVNGYISASREDYWYDFSKVAGGTSAIINDAANWPAIRGRSHSGFERKRVWINDRGSRFRNVAASVGVTQTFDGRSVSMADFGNVGALDVVVANQKAPLLLYRNHVDPATKWIQFELEGTKSNRSAIGAQVELHWDGQKQRQDVSGATGFCAQNQHRLHFGLGKNPRIEKAVIRWPSGREQTIPAPAVNQLHAIKEPA